ncbi:MAG: clostripain-related cysteine peptidase [Marinifilaceae bacterium]|jgi:hypothetical protein|nr:clostripain-related cysteine peptidase [Marinifilaceae bacterium]
MNKNTMQVLFLLISFYLSPTNIYAKKTGNIETGRLSEISIIYKEHELNSGDKITLAKTAPNISREFQITIKNNSDSNIEIEKLELDNPLFQIVTDINTIKINADSKSDIILSYNPKLSTESPDISNLDIKFKTIDNSFKLLIEAESALAKWTYMVYLYEDGTDLDGNKDINEWEFQGSIDGVLNYIVLYDSDYNHKDGIYYISKDENGQDSKIISKRISTHLNYGLDMNDANTFKEFSIWCKENFPAEHYGINLWDHGSGIFRKTGTELVRAACGSMTLWDLSKAAKSFKDIDGKGFDIIGFDVCLLGQVETVYELKDLTDIVIASERTEPGDGWDYNTQFSALNNNPNINKYDFAEHIVDEFANSYNRGSQGHAAITQAAIRTDVFKSEFIPKLNALSDRMINEMPSIKFDLTNTVDNSTTTDGYRYIEHKDIGDFLSLLKEKTSISAELLQDITNLQKAYNNSIVKFRELYMKGTTGLKIWIPKAISKNYNRYYYENKERYLKISETKWDEFLHNFESNKNTVPQPNFQALDIENIYIGKTVSIVDITKTKPEANYREWTISPNSYEFVDGCDSKSKSLKVRFLSKGNYSIGLKLENELGEASEYKQNYIDVRVPIYYAPKKLKYKKHAKNLDVFLSWEHNKYGSDGDFSHYAIFRNDEFLDMINSPEYKDVIENKTDNYTYSVQAAYFDYKDNIQYSVNSNTINIQHSELKAGAPELISCEYDIYNNQIHVNWKESEESNINLDYYQIYRNNVLYQDNYRDTKFIDKSIDKEEIYNYFIKAVYPEPIGISEPSESSFVNPKTLGIENIEINEVSIYPNPCKSKFYIRSKSPQKLRYKIYNIKGNYIREGELTKSETELSIYKPGMYIIRILSNKQNSDYKLIVE